MKYIKARTTRLMLDYFNHDNRRIEHALSVLFEAERLMLEESISCDHAIVVVAALLHDIGIKVSEEKLGYNNGKTQEEYGPPVAGELLESINFPGEKIAIVKEIIANHHSPSRHDYPELEILKRADRIVNINEKNINNEGDYHD